MTLSPSQIGIPAPRTIWDPRKAPLVLETGRGTLMDNSCPSIPGKHSLPSRFFKASVQVALTSIRRSFPVRTKRSWCACSITKTMSWNFPGPRSWPTPLKMISVPGWHPGGTSTSRTTFILGPESRWRLIRIGKTRPSNNSSRVRVNEYFHSLEVPTPTEATAGLYGGRKGRSDWTGVRLNDTVRFIGTCSLLSPDVSNCYIAVVNTKDTDKLEQSVDLRGRLGGLVFKGLSVRRPGKIEVVPKFWDSNTFVMDWAGG